MKIKLKTDYVFPFKVSGGEVRHYLKQGEVIKVQDISPNGWARIRFQQGGDGFIPHEAFEVFEEPKERTYTETEMKAIRSEWEEKWVLQQNRLDQAESSKSYWESQAKREREHGYRQKHKLDLLTPEIQRIEEAVRRIIPGDKEGSLAEHVEDIVSDYLMIQWAGRQDGIVFAEVHHPEDDFEAQNQAYEESIVGRWEKIQQELTQAMEPVKGALRAAAEQFRQINEQIAKGEEGPFNKIDDREGF